MSRIAYASHQGTVYTIDPDTGDRKAVTPSESVCTWPTWSPDGNHLAFSSLQSGDNGHGRLGIYLKGAEESAPRLIYANSPGTDAIARSTPHYVLWSPDSRRLAFIAQTLGGKLSLFVQDIHSSSEPVRLIDSGPIYASWSPDSRYLVTHSSRSHYLVDFEAEQSARRSPGSSTSYMAPSWSPTANRIAMFRDSGHEMQILMIADVAEASAKILAEVTGVAGFGWSPIGNTIGLARNLDSQSGFYSGLWLIDAEGSEQKRVSEDPLLCFFWSPDGSKIAYITPSEGVEGLLRWGVLNIRTGTIRYLADFRPTQEQLITFMFFDQYGQSHTPWSPDSRHLVFASEGGLQAARTPFLESDEAIMFVANVEGHGPPGELAKGFLGFWSPA